MWLKIFYLLSMMVELRPRFIGGTPCLPPDASEPFGRSARGATAPLFKVCRLLNGTHLSQTLHEPREISQDFDLIRRNAIGIKMHYIVANPTDFV